MKDLLTPLHASSAVLLVIDFQDKLMAAMPDVAGAAAAARRMIEAAGVLGVPAIVTEQYPAGLGRTCSSIREVLGGAALYEKTRFSGCVEPVVETIRQSGRTDVIIVGIEAHVCVQQSVLDLLRLGLRPVVCADAINSRRAFDCQVAIERMRQAGAVVTTTESAIFEMLGEAGTEAFKKVLRIVK